MAEFGTYPGATLIFTSLMAGLVLYFLPAFIARDKPNKKTVFAINLGLGWTAIGWVVALIMALSDPAREAKPTPVEPPIPAPIDRVCPRCAKQVQPTATACDQCGLTLPL